MYVKLRSTDLGFVEAPSKAPNPRWTREQKADPRGSFPPKLSDRHHQKNPETGKAEVVSKMIDPLDAYPEAKTHVWWLVSITHQAKEWQEKGAVDYSAGVPDLVSKEWKITVAPGADKDLAALKTTKLEAIHAEYKKHRDAGTTFAGESIATTADAMLEMTEVKAALVDGDIISPQKARTRAQKHLDLDLATATALLKKAREHRSACVTNEDAHVTAVEALTAAQAVFEYDEKTGWP